ncbi:MAG: hypothetical protein CL579_16490 [Alteromonadaceae bacterium]|uniref:Uncharacterized protein n=1 Tax=Paraglaciecola mesophila KMM 241 TaxID=1128912 RepID=K6YXB0_9ALTE|nr:hypothetical protein [Paraglaciecola mesophila]MAD17641.1 hypothetical protein [Alteromonadaceae bacterium]MBB20325.1 hypothetical protein [Rickettsiales bacterium]GAC22787.1 hypothetical protein GMES_0481 [Paraglaciecola mesophila KMM 241]|tara:strand:- start:902 stop:1147 length:246 start_codon:yes stop_codon:yes gene_type:complete
MITMIITLLGLLIFIVGAVLLLLEAFNQSLFWGLACLFIQPICLVFIVRYWRVAKLSFYTQAAGFSILLIGLNLHSHFNPT